jgi:hypothetical protein
LTLRKTLAYWTLAALLFAFYWTVERVPGPPGEQEVKKERVLPMFSDEVVTFIVERDGRSAAFERKDKRWKIVSPKGAEVPSDLVAALVETLAEKQDAEVIADSPKEDDLRSYGLDKPSTVYEVKAADGKKVRVEVGSKNPTRTAMYARSDQSPRVLLVGLNIEYYGDLVIDSAFGRKDSAKS